MGGEAELKPVSFQSHFNLKDSSFMRWLFISRGFFLSPRPLFACGRLQWRRMARGRRAWLGLHPDMEPRDAWGVGAASPRIPPGAGISRSDPGETITTMRCRKLIQSQTGILITGKVKTSPPRLRAGSRQLPRSVGLGDPEHHDCIDSIILYNVILCICVIATNRVERHTKINDLKVNMAE